MAAAAEPLWPCCGGVARRYALRLPAGSRYAPLSGPLRSEAAVPLTGLRPFALPFLNGSAASAFTGTRHVPPCAAAHQARCAAHARPHGYDRPTAPPHS
jgi:hypothetical protein